MEVRIGGKIRMIEMELSRQINRDLNEDGLSNSQLVILGFLRMQPEYSATQKDIQQFLRIAQPTAVRLLRGMENKGLIRCEIRPDLGGKKWVTLLRTDEVFWGRVSAFNETIQEQLRQGFSDEEVQLLENFLDRVYDNLLSAEDK